MLQPKEIVSDNRPTLFEAATAFEELGALIEEISAVAWMLSRSREMDAETSSAFRAISVFLNRVHDEATHHADRFIKAA